MNILTFVEHKNGNLKKASIETLSVGKSIADQTNGTLSVVLIGDGVKELARRVGTWGVRTAFVCDDTRLANLAASAVTRIVTDITGKFKPDILLFPFSAFGKELVPAVGACLSINPVSDCVKVDISDAKIVCRRPVYAGKALMSVSPKLSPAIISIRPNVFPVKEDPVETTIEEISGELLPKDFLTIVKEIPNSGNIRPELTEAKIIVSGGRGVGGLENFSILEQLADHLGAAVAASRAVVDAGWMPQSIQVGQTGKTVSPDLYIACGISGAIQHLAGIYSSKCIVAINKDPDAVIFKVADYGIIGDVLEIVPGLIDELSKTKWSSKQ